MTSTTGNGDAPENASRFVRYLKRKSTIDQQPFQYCAYAVLGLGDTNYDDFCATGKVVDSKMQQLGGTRGKTLGMADEATGLEDVVEPWTSSVVKEMVQACFGSGSDGEATTCTTDANDATTETEKAPTETETAAATTSTSSAPPATTATTPSLPTHLYQKSHLLHSLYCMVPQLAMPNTLPKNWHPPMKEFSRIQMQSATFLPLCVVK